MNINKLKYIAYETLHSMPCINQFPIDARAIAKELGIFIKKDSSKQYLNGSNEKIANLIILDTITIYYDGTYKSKDINYAISCEIARHILQSKDLDAQDLYLLGTFLLCPPVVLKSLKLNQPHEISVYCNIPKDKTKLYLSQLTYHSNNRQDVEKLVLNQFKPFIKSFKHQQPFRPLLKFIANIMYKEGIKEVDPNDKELIKAIEYVYVLPGNLFYHNLGCTLLKGNEVKLPIKIALSKGYKPCPKCYKNQTKKD